MFSLSIHVWIVIAAFLCVNAVMDTTRSMAWGQKELLPSEQSIPFEDVPSEEYMEEYSWSKKSLLPGQIEQTKSKLIPSEPTPSVAVSLHDCQLKSVTLIRISSAGVKWEARQKAYQFLVDSSIRLLVIYVNSTMPYDTNIDSPEGTRQFGESAKIKVGDQLEKKSMALYSVEFGFQHGKWTVQEPAPGVWTVYFRSQFELLEVRGRSCIDFSYKFLDTVKYTPLDIIPRENTNALVRLRVAGSTYISSLLYLEMRNVSNTLLKRVEVQTASVFRVSFVMPLEPFYFSILGFDSTQTRFERLNPRLVSHQQFHLRWIRNHTGFFVSDKANVLLLEICNLALTDDVFHTTVSFNQPSTCCTATLVKQRVHVEGLSVARVEIDVRIEPHLLTVIKRTLVATVTKLTSDGVQRLTQTITAAPTAYLTDHDPPHCIPVSSSGTCYSIMPCATQVWGREVNIEDGQTGVKSAFFIHVIPHVYNTIMFSYLRGNRTATAMYRATCCYTSFTLRVLDYANNARDCHYVAPLNMTTGAPKNPKGITKTPSTESTSRIESSITPKGNNNKTRHTSTVPIQGTTERPLVVTTTRTTVTVTSENSSYEASTYRVQTDGNNDTLHQPSSWTDEKFTTLRIVSIILGCVGLLAGVAIFVICVMYLCRKRRWKRNALRASRHDSVESDVTMGSSWETRSPDSCPGSVRSAINLKVFSRSDMRSESPLRGQSRKRWRPSVYTDSGYFGSGDCLFENGDEYKQRFTVNADNHHHKFSSENKDGGAPPTPKLSRAGDTYSSMLNVQSKLEEMEKMAANKWTPNGGGGDHHHDNDRRHGRGKREEETTGCPRCSGGGGVTSNGHESRESSEYQYQHQQRPLGQGAVPKTIKGSARYRLDKPARNTDNVAAAASKDSGILLRQTSVRSEATDTSSTSSTSGLHDTMEDGECRGRSYSLVLVKEKQKGSPEAFTYRKAALFHNVTLVNTSGELGLVRSFPARIRASDEESQSQTRSSDQLLFYDIRGNARRVRFLSKSTGEMDKDSKGHSGRDANSKGTGGGF